MVWYASQFNNLIQQGSFHRMLVLSCTGWSLVFKVQFSVRDWDLSVHRRLQNYTRERADAYQEWGHDYNTRAQTLQGSTGIISTMFHP